MSVAPVVVVGDVMTDVAVDAGDRLVLGSDARARIAIRWGGAAANVAAWSVALGAPAVLVARVGADSRGHHAASALRAAGVDPRLAVDGDRPTGACVVIVHPDGERSMLTDDGANAALSPADLPDDVWRAGGHLHLSGYVLLRCGSRDAGCAALARARAAEMTSSVDPASAAPLARLGGERFLRLTAGADVALVTRDELEALCGTRDPPGRGSAPARLWRGGAQARLRRGQLALA